ncbi:MAG: hypothetical protein ACI8XB_001952 [Patiriisocius sp.]|jgi:hypothetical protein
MGIAMRFSGHETFHCKHFWLKKGYDFVESGNEFKEPEAVVKLGVGKNMVSSISFWLKAFGLLSTENSELSEFGYYIFSKESGKDTYLEDEGTLWLLHYMLQKKAYASIYGVAFKEFRKNRVSFDFTATALSDFIVRKCKIEKYHVSENSIKSDVKVFLRSYLPPNKQSKSIEDELSALFIDLHVISPVQGLKENGEQVYRFNYGSHQNIPILIFLYAVLDYFEDNISISFDDIQDGVSDLFMINREQTLDLIQELADEKFLTYKEDAGRKEVQLKKGMNMNTLLDKYYV